MLWPITCNYYFHYAPSVMISTTCFSSGLSQHTVHRDEHKRGFESVTAATGDNWEDEQTNGWIDGRMNGEVKTLNMRFVSQSPKKKRQKVKCYVEIRHHHTHTHKHTHTHTHVRTQSHRQRTVKIQDACITLTVVYAVIERHFPLRKHPYDYNHSFFLIQMSEMLSPLSQLQRDGKIFDHTEHTFISRLSLSRTPTPTLVLYNCIEV